MLFQREDMLLQKVNETVNYIKGKIYVIPDIALILGTGLGDLADTLEDPCIIPYEEIPGFMVSTAPGHKGRMVTGRLSGRNVLCMQGRFHFYEGYSMQEITYPIRVMKELGIKKLIITNSCGGINPDFIPGDLMLITDHINFMGTNPLIGKNEDDFGVRFPDMTYAYDRALGDTAVSAAADLGIKLQKGIYIGYMGPSYETPAEIRLFRMFGGSAVGMSTVPEVIVANHCGIRVLAISCITNFAAGILDQPLTSEEVVETANKTGAKFKQLLSSIVERME